MGFGILFFGFFMLIEVSVSTSADYPLGIDLLPDLAGYILMLTAAMRLSAYAQGFKKAKKALYPLCAVGLIGFVTGFLSAFPLVDHAILAVISQGVKYAGLVLQPVALWFLFSGMISLADSLDLPKIVSRARYAAVVGLVYYVAQLAFMVMSDLPLELAEEQIAVPRYFLMILWLVFVFFAEFIAFQCYRYICYEGEERLAPGDLVNPFEKLFGKFGKGKGD